MTRAMFSLSPLGVQGVTGLGYGEVGGLIIKVTLWGVVAGELLAESEDCDILFFSRVSLGW